MAKKKKHTEALMNVFQTWQESQHIPKKAQVRHVAKGTILQQAGQVVRKGFYVKKGLLRSYWIDPKGKLHIFLFAPEGWVVTDAQSHALKVPSELFIDALEDSELLEVDIDQVQELDLSPEFFKMERHQLMRRVAVLQKRVMLLISASARERYEHFLETYPDLFNRVPLKMIAAYLGITPEALSNVRRAMRHDIS